MLSSFAQIHFLKNEIQPKLTSYSLKCHEPQAELINTNIDLHMKNL